MLEDLRSAWRRDPALYGARLPEVLMYQGLEGLDSATVATRLARGYGIGVRDGLFCAHPLTRQMLARAPVALPGTAVRASLGLGTTTADVDRLLAALAEIVRAGRVALPDQ